MGKAVKTIFLCRYLHDIELRREIHEGLNVIENWNSVNGFIMYGKGVHISHQDEHLFRCNVNLISHEGEHCFA